MDSKIQDEIIHRAELKMYLSENELTLPDSQREAILLERKLLDSGLLREADLIVNRDLIHDSARKMAAQRNGFNFSSWLDSLPNWPRYLMQLSLLIGGFLLFRELVQFLDSVFLKY